MNGLKTGIKKKIITFACLISGVFCSTFLFASDDTYDKKHFIGVFAGVLDGVESDTVLGIEYEYKLNSHWGVGALYEDASDAHNGDGVSAIIGSVYYHPAGGWRIGAAVGEETIGGLHPHSETLYRAGVSYDFHVGGMGIEPSFNVDFIGSETVYVYGVALVWSF